LIEPGTRYEDRVNQLDFRLSKNFTARRNRIMASIDIYNVFNASPILDLNSRYGPGWLQPTVILPGRLFKFGVQLDF
jgi:outer membrane receptor protein involved in Fe transport